VLRSSTFRSLKNGAHFLNDLLIAAMSKHRRDHMRPKVSAYSQGCVELDGEPGFVT